MSGTTPNFKDWQRMDVLSVWEIASLMVDVDPRAMSNVTDEYGNGLTLDDEIDEIVRGLLAGKLTAALDQSIPYQKQTKVLNDKALSAWLHDHDHDELAYSLAHTKGNDTDEPEWVAEAVRIANRIANERWAQGQREITARNIADAVSQELAKDKRYFGNRGPRAANSVRNIALSGWRFTPPDTPE